MTHPDLISDLTHAIQRAHDLAVLLDDAALIVMTYRVGQRIAALVADEGQRALESAVSEMANFLTTE